MSDEERDDALSSSMATTELSNTTGTTVDESAVAPAAHVGASESGGGGSGDTAPNDEDVVAHDEKGNVANLNDNGVERVAEADTGAAATSTEAPGTEDAATTPSTADGAVAEQPEQATDIVKTAETPSAAEPPAGGAPASTAASAAAASADDTELIQPLRKRTPADFTFGEELGVGSFSTVLLATEKETGRQFAVKVLEKRHIIKEKKIKYVNSEKAVLNKISHPFFVKLYYTFQDPQKLYFVLTYCSRGEVLSHLVRLKAFSLSCTRHYAAELTAGLEYMHGLGIIHRDLKPENILFHDDWHIRITDFGTAKILEPSGNLRGERSNSFVGTAEYVSPELLTEKTATQASDLWALGCIVYQFLVGKPPFKGGNEYQTFQKITKLQYEFPEGFPAEANDLVNRLLVLDVGSRVGSEASGGYEALRNHAFFSGIDWEGLATSTPPELAPPEKMLEIRAAGTVQGHGLMGLQQVPEGGGELSAMGGSDESDDEGPASGAGSTNVSRRTSAAVGVANSVSSATMAAHGVTPMDLTLASAAAGVETPRPASNMGTNGTGMTAASGGGSTSAATAESAAANAADLLRWQQFVEPPEQVLKAGMVLKRKGLSTKRRMLLLSDLPRLQYIDVDKMVVKGEIPWSLSLRAEAKGNRPFLIHTHNRTYNMEDVHNGAKGWCDAINALVARK